MARVGRREGGRDRVIRKATISSIMQRSITSAAIIYDREKESERKERVIPRGNHELQ